MLKKNLFLSLLLVPLTLFACDDGDKKSNPSLPLAEVEGEYYNLFCEQIETCEVNPYFSMVIEDRQGCLDFITSQTDGPGLGGILDAVDAGTVVYDAEKGYACIEDMKALPCDEFGDHEPESCVGVFTGTIADGEECRINEECVSGYCDTSEACPGTCVAAVAVGGTCALTDECESGAKCVLGECTVFTAPVAEGQPCDSTEDWCAEGLFCHPETEVCTARLAEGTECEEVSDLECEAGTLCFGVGGEAKTCKALTILETADAACDYNAGLMCAAYEDLTCAIDDFQAFTGTCQPFTRLDEVCFEAATTTLTSCDMFADLYCDMSGGFQQDGHCAAKKAGGVACTDSDQCLSGFCDNDVCADEEEVCQ